MDHLGFFGRVDDICLGIDLLLYIIHYGIYLKIKFVVELVLMKYLLIDLSCTWMKGNLSNDLA